MMKRVVIESPYSGDIARNELYARRCLLDSLMRGEAPFVSHLLYTQSNVLNDEIPAERTRGMQAGWKWIEVADSVVFYMDYGMTDGMKAGRTTAANNRISTAERFIGQNS